jgi:hypothetical protein
MPASSIAALLDYETNIEDAVRTFLLGSGYFGATHQILTPRTLLTTEAELETPRVTVALNVSGSGMLEEQRTTDSAWYQAERTGTLQIIVTARRDGAGQSIGTMRGKVRKAMLDATAALDGSTLPYYSLLTVIESGAQNSGNAENDELACAMNFDVRFCIKPDAWPAS